MTLFLGIDGGATKTKVVVVDETGALQAEAQTGASNYQIVGVESAAQHLAQGITAALSTTGSTPAAVTGMVAGFAGLDGPADVDPVSRLMRVAMAQVGIHAPWQAVNDAVVAWAGALGGKPGAIIISGSGAIAFAVNQEGQSAHADGWGHWLGDEGSGFDIGRRGLQAAVRAADGRGPATLLLDQLLSRHGNQPETWKASVSQLNAAGSDDAHAQIASFAPEVVQVADKGDHVAHEILREAGHNLAHTAAGALRHVELIHAANVATVGSLFVHSLILRDYFSQTLHQLLPGAVVHWPQAEPAQGAALLARRPGLIPGDVVSVKRDA
jgi:glucosamine kinase